MYHSFQGALIANATPPQVWLYLFFGIFYVPNLPEFAILTDHAPSFIPFLPSSAYPSGTT
jgi:hypothetical protein